MSLILISTIAISLISLVGLITLSMRPEKIERFILPFVALSAGAMMGGAFLHLLPEAVDRMGTSAFPVVLISFIGFFLVERVLHWHHCHGEDCDIHTFGYMNLIGDFIHNFIDGLVIAAAFVADVHLGWTTAFAMALHEIPQEVGDFGVLMHAGFSRTKAILLNLATAASAVIGGIIGYIFVSQSATLESLLLPIAAGGFLYIAGSDLLPELRKTSVPKHALQLFLVFLVGVSIMLAAKVLGVE
jgi:zinc and cadmium transporter